MKLKICAKVFMNKEKNNWWNDPERNMPIKRKIKFFKLKEFDSPDQPGSGKKNMNINFVERLDQAREMAGVSFIITSGYRTKKYNDDLKNRGYKTSSSSEHMKGNAADIATPTSMSRYKILKALLDVGFRRIGIGKSFIHVDCASDKSQEVVWNYY